MSEQTRSEDVADVLSLILDVCLDINVRDSKTDSSPLEDILDKLPKVFGSLQYYLQYRQTVELYIYGNPDLNRQKPVAKSLRTDENVYKRCNKNWDLFFSFASQGIPVKMDCKQHAIFRHNDQESFAFNIMTPLLVECGFRVTKETRKAFEKIQESLHPAEVQYLKFCLDTPRSLKLCCRDTLQRHFRGHQIHKFVEASEIPLALKDFILLKPLLKSVPQ